MQAADSREVILRSLGQRLVEALKPEDAKHALLEIVGGADIFETINKVATDGRRRKRHEKIVDRPLPLGETSKKT